MGVAGIGSSLASVGVQYDFTKMTNNGLLTAARQLSSEGKISSGDEAELMGMASGAHSTPVDRSQVTSNCVTDTLNNPTPINFLNIVQEYAASDHASNMTKAAALEDSITKDLMQYQGTSVRTNIGTFSTAA
jgi:hypothetical protein